jgi:sterol desaturase/sphingolipid hydroxylase (fatty acid hydroxylase superfamily)
VTAAGGKSTALRRYALGRPVDLSYIHLAIPVFFLLIGLELGIARLLERDVYRLNDSINDLSCGILQQLADVFLKTVLFAAYLWLYQGHRLFAVPSDAPWAWLACFLGVDFLYYWFHRFSHVVNAGWAAHVVHHQSEEMNLAVALRQGAFQQAFSWVFYLPLAVLGFPPLMFLAVSSFNTLYQFWIHTRLIGRLGPLEWVLNTPSHHRVHHGRNPKYLDRNHGGTLIVWDRVFGTFQAEEEEPVYGITTPLRSWNPVWANLHYWADLVRDARRMRRRVDRLRLFWKHPGWRPAELGGFVAAEEVDRATYVKYDRPVPRGMGLYAVGHFAGVNVLTTAFLFGSEGLDPGWRLAGTAALVLSLVSLGGLLDQRRWAIPLEFFRLVLWAILAWWAPLPRIASIAALLFAALSGPWLLRTTPPRATEPVSVPRADGLRSGG